MNLERNLPSFAAMVVVGLIATSPVPGDEKGAPAGSVVPEPSPVTPEPAKDDAGAAPDPLTGIIEKMKSAGNRLDQGLLDDETRQTQNQIVAELEKLLRQSRQKSQSPPPPQPDPSASPNREPAGSQPDSPGSEGGSSAAGGQRRQDQKDAAESTERTEGGIPTEAERKNQRRVLTDAVWGHLPPRIREQLNRSISDRYLPEYEALVKRYYEALATRRREAEPGSTDADRSRDASDRAGRDGAPSP